MLTDGFIQRLRAAYLDWLQGFGGAGESIWSSIDAIRRDVHDALIAGAAEQFRDLVLAPRGNKLYFGVDDLYDHGRRRDADGLAQWVAKQRERFYALGYALALCRTPNPEGGELYEPGATAPRPDVEDLLHALDIHCGARIEFPNPFPGEEGLQTSRGIASERAIFAIYQAMLLVRARRHPVLEIGAGMGRTAYYARRFGIADYTIVDLPLSLVGQAVFLTLTLGEDAISFGLDTPSTGKIELLSPAQFEADARRFPLILNVDSVPEMDPAFVTGYVARMQRDRAYFISINQEANRFTVNDVMPHEARLFRGGFLLRPGYIEEHYSFE
jgi:hypothetical protein